MTKIFITKSNCRYSIWVQLPFQQFVLLHFKPKRKEQNSPPSERESQKAQNPFSRRQGPPGREELSPCLTQRECNPGTWLYKWWNCWKAKKQINKESWSGSSGINRSRKLLPPQDQKNRESWGYGSHHGGDRHSPVSVLDKERRKYSASSFLLPSIL